MDRPLSSAGVQEGFEEKQAIARTRTKWGSEFAKRDTLLHGFPAQEWSGLR